MNVIQISLRVFLITLAGSLLIGCAVEDNKLNNTYMVKQSCKRASQCFEHIQPALDAIAQANTPTWTTLLIAEGDFYEKVTIRANKLLIRGVGQDKTQLHFDAVAQTSGKYHRKGWGTAGSATLTINADEVRLENLTIENTFDYISNDVLAEDDPKKIKASQGVALLLDIKSDRVTLDHVALVGNQDTLFANGARAYIRNSTISGNYDFIFGNGQLLIEDSTIVSRKRGQPMQTGNIDSYIAAPSTQLTSEFGIVFVRSRLTRESGVPDRSVTLARPWHPTTTFADGRYADPNAIGQASFIDCFMDAHIHEQHWSTMNGTARDGSKSAIFKPQNSRFHESGSVGPGAHSTATDVNWQPAWSVSDLYYAFFTNWEQSPLVP